MTQQTIYHRIRCAKKEFTQDEWADYCKRCREDEKNRIITKIGKYIFNDHDICLNPERETITGKSGSYGFNVTIKWADCGNGLWAYGIDYNTGTGGGGYGVSWADRSASKDPLTGHWNEGWPTELECRLAALDDAIFRVQGSGYWGYDEKRKKQTDILVALIKEHKKSLTRPKVVQLELF